VPDGSGAVLLAVDGGGTKTDVVALAEDGTVLARARGSGSCPQVIGVGQAVSVVDSLVRAVLADVAASRAADGPPAVAHVGFYVSGLDLPVEVEAFAAAAEALPWVRSAGAVVVENDTFALLRAGTDAREAVAVVCGTGINCVGRRADGRTARFPALGRISGDWGGGSELGELALWHAARAVDGRGPATVLAQTVPRALRRPDVATVIEDLHLGRLRPSALTGLAPVLMAASGDGDAVAGQVVDQQAEEIVALAAAALRRLDLIGVPVPVVLGGGVIAGGHARLLDGIAARLARAAPLARMQVVTAPPVLGAVLLVLEACGAPTAALTRAAAALRAESGPRPALGRPSGTARPDQAVRKRA
jgi:N-acetylglucosamine kinase-like BadF-type ATPase